MNAAADLVIIRKPPAILWVSLVCALPFVVLALFVPRFRIFGILFVILAIIRFARQTLSVRVTDKELVLQAAVTRTRYLLRDIKHVEYTETRAAFGATTPSVRLDFFEAPPVRISGFIPEETEALYKAVLAAWQRVQPKEI